MKKIVQKLRKSTSERLKKIASFISPEAEKKSTPTEKIIEIVHQKKEYSELKLQRRISGSTQEFEKEFIARQLTKEMSLQIGEEVLKIGTFSHHKDRITRDEVINFRVFVAK